MGKLPNIGSYYKKQSTNAIRLSNIYKNNLDVIVRYFIRGLFSGDNNLNISIFKSYDEITSFINSYAYFISIKTNTIASLNRKSLNTGKIRVNSN